MEKNKIIKELERRLQVENANRLYLKKTQYSFKKFD